MALLNRPMTAQEIEDALRAPYRLSDDVVLSLVSGPRHQTVVYKAGQGRTEYAKPETFYWLQKPGPSDCEWMIPCVLGALEQRKPWALY